MGCQNSNLRSLCLSAGQSKMTYSQTTTMPLSKRYKRNETDSRLKYLLSVIIEKKCSLISEEFFTFLQNQLSSFYWPESCKKKLLKLLEEYIECALTYESSHSNEDHLDKNTNFIGRFTKEHRLLQDEIFAPGDHKEIFEFFLEIYKKQNNYTYQLGSESMEELYEICEFIINNASNSSEKQLFFLAFYLAMGCRNMESMSIPMLSIEQKLQQTLKSLNEKYIDTPYKNVDDDIRFIFYGIREEKFNRIKTQTFELEEELYKRVRLCEDLMERESQLDQEIFMLVKECKAEKDFFSNTLQKLCVECDGFNFKCNLKLSSRMDTKAMDRVKEKILFKNKENKIKDKKLEYRTLDELIEGEKNGNLGNMQRILSETDIVVLRISDILRGKCMFPSLEDLNEATEKIIKEINTLSEQGEDVKIVEVENRLKSVTNDIVLKIKIRKIVAEFQLMFFLKKGKATQNAIYHKMYEIGRSKIYSSIYMLFDWFEKVSKGFMTSLNSIYRNENQSEENKKIFSELLSCLRIAEGRQGFTKVNPRTGFDEKKSKEKVKSTTFSRERSADIFVSLEETHRALEIYHSILRDKTVGSEQKKRIIKKIRKVDSQDEVSSEEGKENIQFVRAPKINKVYKSIIKVHH